MYEQNAAFEKVLAAHVRADDVVVTHHLPAFESVPARFARSAINAFFVCDMAAHVRARQPKLWIHGQSHDRCDYRIGKTRVVANPLGYPNEVRSLEAFKPAFQLEASTHEALKRRADVPMALESCTTESMRRRCQEPDARP